ncbi:MAG: hypothetical protein CMP48_01580, partial [Rickettsiales bacterium]|nr:hypothetical protein [Rickettsiales bacterium]
VQDSTIWRLATVDAFGSMSRVDFAQGCAGEDSYSTSFEPTLSYSESGDYAIELIAKGANGNVSRYQDTVTILTSTSPDIDFETQNTCISSANTFTSINTSGDITSYAWDFNDDGIIDSTDPNPQVLFDTIAGAGTYLVRLDVESSGGCGNFVEKEITIYPEPPVPSFDVSVDYYCVGNEVTLRNTTVDDEYDGGIQYNWTITDIEDTLTSGDLILSFDVPGEKIIEVYSLIPGCESSVFRDTIFINDLPEVSFYSSPTCDGDIMSFTNQSEAIEFHWDFGDGYISTEENPNHLYADAGSYLVELSVINALGCANSLTKEVVVSAIPQPEFEYDIICQGSETILRDVSVVNGADIAQWEWYVEGQQVSTQKSPELVFESNDWKQITLTVYSTSGCSASYTESLSVLAKPNVQFATEIACFGDSSIIADISNNQEDIINRVWRIDGDIIGSNATEFNYLFSQTGTHEISLSIDNENLCSASETKTIEVLSPPALGFYSTNSCENMDITVTDTSNVFDDPIISRRWYSGATLIGTGPKALVPVDAEGLYDITLEVSTGSSCIFTASQQVEVTPKPDVSFNLSNDYGVPPFSLQATNTTINGDEYYWYVNDEFVSSEIEPKLSFETTGNQLVKVVVFNEFGCVDSTTQVVRSISPVVDLGISELEIVGSNKIGFTLSNNSNIPVDSIEFKLVLEDLFELPEVVYRRIDEGETMTVILNTSLPISSNLNYFCVRMTTPYGVSDENIEDNEVCMNLEQNIIFEPPYPNPTRSTATLRSFLPKSGDVKVTLLDVSGQIQQNLLLENQPAGLTTFVIDMAVLDAGTYFVVIEYDGGSHKSRVIKQ